ncbi:hypothetical protein ACJJTC_016516 [Scirpophaga incertulas]
MAVTYLRQQIDYVVSSVDSLELRQRRKYLLLSGVPEVSDEKVLETSLLLLQKHLGLQDLNCNSFKYCHRLGAYVEGRKRPIVLRFSTGIIRAQVWKAKTKLKGSGLVLAEFLTKNRQALFQTVRKHFGISNLWTSNGSVHVKTPSGSRHRVASMNEFNRLVELHPIYAPSNTAEAPVIAVSSAESIPSNAPGSSNALRSKRSTRR